LKGNAGKVKNYGVKMNDFILQSVDTEEIPIASGGYLPKLQFP